MKITKKKLIFICKIIEIKKPILQLNAIFVNRQYNTPQLKLIKKLRNAVNSNSIKDYIDSI